MKQLKKIAFRLAVGVLALGLYLVVITVTGVGCPIRFVCRFPCSGCGMSHAWLAVLHGDFAGAFACHELFFLGPFFFASLFILDCFRSPRVQKGVMGFQLVCALAFCVRWLLVVVCGVGR